MKFHPINNNQIQQYKNILGDNIEILEGEDEKEVNGTSEEVIIHKAIQSQLDFITEYSVIILEGGKEINTKGNIALLKEQIGKEVTFITHLGYKTVHSIYVYTGKINGILSKDLLENKNLGSREIALNNILSKSENFLLDIEDIDKWDGDYQKGE